ncbi:MAG: hypothetical protein A2Z38_00305 [Planctomycetes bacterium RBG_19FT_COMBO_48_8]|nr:MAG: hypothetical protein A2Z38_00305 [Planctomycetes bacterium RBG_19FT_COMBO_48_8]
MSFSGDKWVFEGKMHRGPLILQAIGVGNLAGLWRGEWSGAPRTARMKLNLGLALLVLAVVVIALSSIVKTR